MVNGYRRVAFTAIVLMGTLVYGSVSGLAQDGVTPASDPAAARAAQARRSHQERLAAVTGNRAAVEAEILSGWSGVGADGRELEAALATLSPDQLLAAQDARTPAELNAAIFGPVPQALGDPDADLVYFPVTPCRIIDTRLAGGILAAGVPRDFDSQGPFAAQGGSATTCGLPPSDVAALALNIVAVSPAGAGDFRAWPAGDPVPTAAVLNYALPGTGLALANTTIVPLKQDVALVPEFTVRADVSAAHLVADVVGYFWSPRATALDCLTNVADVPLAAGVGQTNSGFPSCPAGYALTGAGAYAGAGTNSIIINKLQFQSATVVFCRLTNNTASAVDADCEARCCRVPGR